MTQKSSLSNITNANTFGDWRQRTNELIDVAKKSVTFGTGESGSNVGDVTIDGDLNLSAGKEATFDIIDTIGSADLKVKKNADIEGVLYVNQTSGSDNVESVIQMTSGTDKTGTWQMSTNGTHANLRFTKGNTSLQIGGDGNITSVGTTNLVIPVSMVDGGVFNGVTIGNSTPGTGNFSQLDCTGATEGNINNVNIGGSNAGTGSFTNFIATGGGTSSITNTPIGGGDVGNRSTGSFTALIATGGGNSAINNVPIGGTTKSTGAFTTLSTSGLATLASATVTGTLTATASSADGLTSSALSTVKSSMATDLSTGAGIASINNVPIGGTTKSTGAFTTLSTSGKATLASAEVTGTLTATATLAKGLTETALDAVLKAVYPVNSIYLTESNSTPETLGLPGVWERYAQGKALTGYSTSVSAFKNVNSGGNMNHTLNLAQMPRHRHSISDSRANNPNAYTKNGKHPDRATYDGPDYHTNYTGGTNNGATSAFSLLQPYQVVQAWRRKS